MKIERLEDLEAWCIKTPAGCWDWTRSKTSEGYGSVYLSGLGKTTGTHRIAWSLANNQSIPQGMHIDHLCRNRSCCNPVHLELVTHAENIRRGYAAKGQTHCKRGHDLAIHARLTKDGRRDCRECERIRKAALNESQREARRAYSRKWARKERETNPERVRANKERHLAKKKESA